MRQFRIPILMGLALCLVQLVASGQCQILDNDVTPIYGAHLSLVTSAGFGDYGDSGIVELGGYWDGPYFRDVLFGCDIAASLDADFKFFTGDADVDLPGIAAAVAMDIDLILRYSGGTSFRVGASPGIYSALDGFGGNSFDMPLSVAMIQSFSPAASGIVGMQVRPRFLTKVMPIVGVEWQVVDELRISAMLPESRLTWYVVPDWNTHVGFEWNNMSYALNEGGEFDREQMEVEDFRLTIGVTHRLSDELQLTGELGTVFGRGVDFKEDIEGIDSSLDVEDGVFIGFAVGGPF